MANERGKFVLDVSVTMTWYFQDEVDSYADEIAAVAPMCEIVVPLHWHLEVSNVLVVAERRKRGTKERGSTFLTRLRSLSIRADEETARLAWADILDLARRYQLTTYDAAYLELAKRESLPLATLDKGLKAAAKAAGVKLFRPRTT